MARQRSLLKTLLYLWWAVVFLDGSIVAILFWRGWITSGDAIDVYEALAAAIGPYAGAITGYYWETSRKRSADNTKLLWLSVAGSAFWLVIVSLPLWAVAAERHFIEPAVADIRRIASVSSWILGALLGVAIKRAS